MGRGVQTRNRFFKMLRVAVLQWLWLWLCLFLCLFLNRGLGFLTANLQQDQTLLLAIRTKLLRCNLERPRVGALLSSWDSNATSPCLWEAITCTHSRVTGISLASSDIKGLVYSEFFQLGALTTLDLSQNHFEGGLPVSSAVAETKSLRALNLSCNYLNGSGEAFFTSGYEHLQALDLSYNDLTGSIQKVLPVNCSKLQTINLSSNQFSGGLGDYPWVNCGPTLIALELGKNNLIGLIPDDLGVRGLPNLQKLTLSENRFTGVLPVALFSATSHLRYLDLSANLITGIIPPHLGNATALSELNLAENELKSGIPRELGRLTNLTSLLLGSNFLISIPNDITNCSRLVLLDLSCNELEGPIPGFLGRMPSLKYLILHSNGFSGNIPPDLGLISPLEFLDISNNSLLGYIPGELLVQKFSGLRFLLLADNLLSGNIPIELGNMSKLQFLDLSSNNLSGGIPSQLGKLKDLLWLMLAHNSLVGPIPSALGNCSSLLWFNARSNKLSGSIPLSVTRMGSDPLPTFRKNIVNFIKPPRSQGMCSMMRRWIPENYPPYSFQYALMDRSSCPRRWRDLITGVVPLSTCGDKMNLYGGFFQVSDNNLSGSLPPTFQANQTAILLLSRNSLTGPLPATLRDILLIALNISGNSFSGSIPDSLGYSNCLNLLDLSYNSFSGPIPKSLENLNQLAWFNLSYNPLLTGQVPTSKQLSTFTPDSFIGDPNICFQRATGMRSNVSGAAIRFCSEESNGESPFNRDYPHHQSRPWLNSPNRLHLTLIIAGGCLFGLLLCFGLLALLMLVLQSSWYRPSPADFYLEQNSFGRISSKSNTNSTVLIFGSAKSCLPVVNNLTYIDILVATDNFDEANIVGNGGFGTVYKASMRDGTTVAVKKLTKLGLQGEREFLAEISTLGNHTHKNLVPLLGCCIFGSERMLVYKYLSNGSLDNWLHNPSSSSKRAVMLDWPRRLAIACGVARGLHYLHEECSPAVIHRDLKASNILLDKRFEAHLTDFGLARELDPADTHVSTIIAGTLGYLPPEYGMTWRATTKGDIYSFGVVLLELVTCRKPLFCLEYECANEARNLVEWVQMLMNQNRSNEAFDPFLLVNHSEQDCNNISGQLLEFLELGTSCTLEDPERRPSTKEITRRLNQLQTHHVHSHLNATSPSHLDTITTTSSFSSTSSYFSLGASNSYNMR